MRHAMEVISENPPVEETPEEHFLHVQHKVFKDMMRKEGVTDVRSFIRVNAHLFRYFANHLPDDLKDSWEHAELDETARKRLEDQYELFHARVDAFIAQLDPEIQDGLAQAIADGDVDMASYIMENTINSALINK